MTLTRVEYDRAEIDKLYAEIEKLLADKMEMNGEIISLRAERDKLREEVQRLTETFQDIYQKQLNHYKAENASLVRENERLRAELALSQQYHDEIQKRNFAEARAALSQGEK